MDGGGLKDEGARVKRSAIFIVPTPDALFIEISKLNLNIVT